MHKLNLKPGTWLLTIIAWLLIPSYALYLLVFELLFFPVHMQEDTEQQVVSPDGRRTAVLSYQYARENPIDGIYHIALERPAFWCCRGSHEVTEVDATEIDGNRSLHISWRAPETLVVRYSGTFPEDAFMVREHQWRGVRIIDVRQ
jgi:hypothetical protein